MLSVHRYNQPFIPTSSYATSSRRHQHVLVERGRSRNVSQAALARRRSEERRKHAALAEPIADNTEESASPATASPFLKPRAPSIHNNVPHPSEGPVASTSASHLSSMQRLEQPVCLSSSAARASDSPPQHRVTDPFPVSDSDASSPPFGEDDDSSTPTESLSLQDQMQQAYAACQATCLQSLGQNNCRCRNMHRARVLYLKTQGIDVTSDDDPRIEQVRDEDFVFVPGGELVLDEESLAALKEERERREKEAQERKWRVRGQAWETEAERARVAMMSARQCSEESRTVSQRLEFRAKRARLPRSTTAGPSRQHADAMQFVTSFSSRDDPDPTFRSNRQTRFEGTTPNRVSFTEVVGSLHGSLFPESEPQGACSMVQNRLLDTLLEAVVWQEGERRRAKGKDSIGTGSRTWTEARFCKAPEAGKAPEADKACMACSVSSDSTISRTNSWASSTTDASSSTCITSPSSSPMSSKLQLQSSVNNEQHPQQVSHSCRLHRKSRLSTVAITETPLMYIEGRIPEQSNDRALRRSSQERNNENIKSAIVTRVRQSVYGLVDFASRIQQSYLRTVQFAVALHPDVSSLPTQTPNFTRTCRNGLPSKPAGYRASVYDVQRFAPQPISVPMRDLNFSSEVNIPLGEPFSSYSSSTPPARVFAPLAFVPPSPLRPRETPLTPEWRLRPVANPCTLRLKALANCLSGRGVAWEGRAHTGSLGCGRERLTGVAFEGLGGSRLAFEAK